MCLITNWSFPRLSLKPILCYKIVRVIEYNKLMGIHQKDYKYNTNKLNKCFLFPIRGKEEFLNNFRDLIVKTGDLI